MCVDTVTMPMKNAEESARLLATEKKKKPRGR